MRSLGVIRTARSMLARLVGATAGVAAVSGPALTLADVPPLATPVPSPAKPGGRESRFSVASEASDGVLSIQHIRKAYKARRVVEDVSLTVRRGEAVGLLGPNGAGKTTTFYMITGLVRPDAGTIALDGHDVTSLPMYRRARLGIGYLPQEASIFRGLSVEDNIRAVLEIAEPDKSENGSTRTRRACLPSSISRGCENRRPSPYPGASGSRCEIARALANRPSLHAARRTLRRHRSDRGRRHSRAGPASEKARHRRPHHRPQRP